MRGIVDTARADGDQAAVALLRELHAGADAAWDRLHQLVGPSIRQFAAARLPDQEAAEDIVVETLAHAARGITRFDPRRASLLSWVLGIARRRVQLELRWQRRQKSVPAWAQVSFEDLSELADSHDLAARSAARLDAQRRITELTALVSDFEVELLSLSAVEGLPGGEIAAVVGRSEEATRVALHRARRKVQRIGIEGTLVVQGNECTWHGDHYRLRPYTHWFEGTSDSRRGHETGHHTSVSPAGDEIVYVSDGSQVTVWPWESAHIWGAKRDGSGAVNLSAQAGLRGVNAYPRWSPDGTMVAFLHWDEPGGEAVGPGEVWVMAADASEARRAVPKAILRASAVAWAPDGSGLLCSGKVAVPAALPAWVDLSGRPVEVAAAVASPGEWSPDGSKLARICSTRGESQGERGWWKQLVVTKADGSAPKTLVEQFIPDGELERQRPSPEELALEPAVDWREDFLHWAGPAAPTWSPTGDKIAFLAALPYAGGEADCKRRIDAWVYDLVTRRLTKLTHDLNVQHSLSWQ